ncbi:TadE/TadG family type IV pilus assembly protein [Paraburkholderia domus]|jgi:Flp pilus assembly protein TadG|uniref:TadE-like domain-containing protein n=1 Tax=Paraburkholderia domus TaxID=2793075 RepID=A0A9N8MMI8_9BURK|nr:TadE/TadG family type IV pilus assembly protein [Paraburkholderia domus]MBK5051053.1 pilus assembly protein [Burkholderia sp. R-70006]MBK5064993.1 pilus assembly protein [Burkholderia sp. R-70199]MBK5118631.1 pilus assembly protein [Burkholderia sp. R-69980]MBK5164469.1 pilus assembly protein [Burkholderia sp. R-70211]MCI0144651.1 pilus assembly protein [Paraburkholderia sediminicola]
MKRKNQRGATAVEFALVLPILLALLFGTVQFGWLMNNYLALTNAASLGAHLLASERGYATPYSDTQRAILASTPALTSALTISMSVGGTSCTSDSTCASALGTSTQAPAAGTVASVSLGYTFLPLFTGALYSLKSIMPSSLTATMSELVQ